MEHERARRRTDVQAGETGKETNIHTLVWFIKSTNLNFIHPYFKSRSTFISPLFPFCFCFCLWLLITAVREKKQTPAITVESLVQNFSCQAQCSHAVKDENSVQVKAFCCCGFPKRAIK